MNANGLAMLADPEPCGHIVFPYSEEAQLIAAVALFASAGLGKTEAVVLVMTPEHKVELRERLKEDGFDVRELESIGQLTWVDAESFLSSFVFDGIIDELVFTTKVGSLLDKAAVSGGKSRRVRMFGEMVNFLWTDNPRAAERLEQLWNQLIGAHRVPVLCVYALAGTQAGRLPASLLACHSQAIG